MLYSIIPPILVVLSLIGIVIFLMKKAKAVAELGENYPEEKQASGDGLPGRADSKFFSAVKKIPEFFKLFFSKLGNKFSRWAESRKRKKEMRAEKQGGYVLENTEETVEEEKIVVQDDKVDDFFQRGREKKERNVPAETVLEVPAEAPRATFEKKDLFEKILIERIAANPKDIEAYERLGEYYLEIENWNYAKECFKQVIKLNPGNVGAKAKMRKLERILGR
jgi:tetratricopeptide (TPR) repeat protein